MPIASESVNDQRSLKARMFAFLPRFRLAAGFYLLVGGLLLIQAVVEEGAAASGLLILLSAGILALIVVNGVFCVANLRFLGVSYEFPTSVTAGVSFRIASHVQNYRSFLGAPLVSVSYRGGLGFHEKEDFVLAPYIGPGKSTCVESDAIFLRRGTQMVSQVTLATSFPFGLMRFARSSAIRQSVVVYPRSLPLPPGYLSKLDERGKRGVGPSRGRGGNDEIYGLRRYRSGDARSHIHWRTSARAGKAMVVMHEDRRERNYRIVLDTWVGDREVVERSALERLVSMATGTLHHLANRGLRFGYRHADPEVRFVDEGDGLAQRHAILGSLANVGYSPSPLSEWSRRAFEGLRPHDVVLLFTLSTKDSIQAIADAAGLRAIIISIQSPDVTEHLVRLGRQALQNQSNEDAEVPS